MTAPASLRVGWCPGALRPMMAGDGLLVRVKPRGSALSTGQARALAGLATRFGNGILNITGRANLQLRGVAVDDVSALTDALASLGLLDPSPQGEAVRNVVSSPLAGHDARALLDIRPVVAALEQRLVSDPSLWGLPAKFAWAVDDGGRLGLDGIPADISFEAVPLDGAAVFAIGLADGREAVAFCRPDDVPSVAAALACAFLGTCAAHTLSPHRMREIVALSGGGPIMDRAAERAGVRFLYVEAGDDGVRREGARGAGSSEGGVAPIGLHRGGPQSWIGVAPPFGRLEAGSLQHFAAEVEAVGANQIRLTPWRTMLAAGLSEPAAASVWGRLVAAASEPSGAALILDPDDSRLNVAACAGAPACPRATTPVQADAARLAALLPAGRRGTQLHVSGCAKGCAHAGTAPTTLVGRDGGYDLVRNGTASDAPVRTSLSIEAIVALPRMSDRVPAC